MKKIIIISILILTFAVISQNVNASSIMIPEEAIRLRVIANSDSEYDQQIKLEVATKVQNEIYNLLKDTKTIQESRETIKENIPIIENAVEKVFKEKSYINTFNIKYGYNFFPEKEYKGVTYPEGEYESLLITLGKGEGKNWWCVLFPPLCLIEAEESEEVEYKFFVQELIEKYF